MKRIILFASLIVIGVMGMGQITLAANSALSVFPSSAEKTVGTAFDVFVKIDPAGNKVCVVKGTLSFSNLSCQNITVNSGLIAQTSPTCANPSFTLGIPQCAMDVQNMLAVSAKGNQTGEGSLSLNNVVVIGVGEAIPAVAQGGVYYFAAQAVVLPPQTSVKTPTPTTKEPVLIAEIADELLDISEQIADSDSASFADGQTAGLLDGFSGNKALIILAIIAIALLGAYFVNKRRKKTV